MSTNDANETPESNLQDEVKEVQPSPELLHSIKLAETQSQAREIESSLGKEVFTNMSDTQLLQAIESIEDVRAITSLNKSEKRVIRSILNHPQISAKRRLI